MLDWTQYRRAQRRFISDFLRDPYTVRRLSDYFGSELFDLLDNSKQIGQGKQGAVYRYGDYALKILPYKSTVKVEPLSGPSFVGTLAVRLHPAVSEYLITKLVNGVYGLSLKGNQMLFVTDYYNTSFKTHIRSLDSNSFEEFILETYNSLVGLQSRGFLVHGDLKVDNIMVKNNRAYLIDFGQSSMSVNSSNGVYRIIPDRFHISCKGLVLDRPVTFNYSLSAQLWTRYCNIPYYSSFNFVTLVVSILCYQPELINNPMLATLIRRTMVYSYKKTSSCGYNDILKAADGITFLPLLERIERAEASNDEKFF